MTLSQRMTAQVLPSGQVHRVVRGELHPHRCVPIDRDVLHPADFRRHRRRTQDDRPQAILGYPHPEKVFTKLLNGSVASTA